jgi:hypothetical protein
MPSSSAAAAAAALSLPPLPLLLPLLVLLLLLLPLAYHRLLYDEAIDLKVSNCRALWPIIRATTDCMLSPL